MNDGQISVHSVVLRIAAFLFLLIGLQVLLPYTFFQPVPLVAYAMQLLNTVIHEAGHMVFGLLGSAPGVAGGTLLQLGIPVAVLISAIFNGTRFGIGFAVFWIGQNLVGISLYIADASERQLEFFQWWAAFGGPMLDRGSKDHHDWYIMLNSVGLLNIDWLVSGIVYLAGILFMLAAISYLYLPQKIESLISLWFEKLSSQIRS